MKAEVELRSPLKSAGNTRSRVDQVWDSGEQWGLGQAGESSGQLCPSECRSRVAGILSFPG